MVMRSSGSETTPFDVGAPDEQQNPRRVKRLKSRGRGKPRNSSHRCPGCGGMILTETCLGCEGQIRREAALRKARGKAATPTE